MLGNDWILGADLFSPFTFPHNTLGGVSVGSPTGSKVGIAVRASVGSAVGVAEGSNGGEGDGAHVARDADSITTYPFCCLPPHAAGL